MASLRDIFSTNPGIGFGAGGGIPGSMGMGQQYAAPGQGSHGSNFNYQAPFRNPNAQIAPTWQVQLPQQRFDLMRQQSADQINRTALTAQQDLQRNYGTRGIGRSGLELQAAGNQLRQGALQQIGDANRQLNADMLGQQYTEAQQYRNLEAQRRQQQAALNLQGQQGQAAENLSRSQLGLNEAIQLGQLGLSERQQSLAEFGARDKYENPGYGLGPLYQAAQAAASAGGQGKGGK